MTEPNAPPRLTKPRSWLPRTHLEVDLRAQQVQLAVEEILGDGHPRDPYRQHPLDATRTGERRPWLDDRTQTRQQQRGIDDHPAAGVKTSPTTRAPDGCRAGWPRVPACSSWSVTSISMSAVIVFGRWSEESENVALALGPLSRAPVGEAAAQRLRVVLKDDGQAGERIRFVEADDGPLVEELMWSLTSMTAWRSVGERGLTPTPAYRTPSARLVQFSVLGRRRLQDVRARDRLTGVGDPGTLAAIALLPDRAPVAA